MYEKETNLLLFFVLVSCSKDDTPETSINDALKISAYVYNEDGETWSFQQLRLNEPKELVPTYKLQADGTEMENFNLRFEYDDGTSRHFSIEILSYEYSDFYKMLEGAG